MLVNASGISKHFGEQILFSELSFSVDDNDKIGLIGVNGAGKTTLFNMIIGTVTPDSGEMFKSKQLKIGYIEQYACENSDKTVFSELLSAFDEVIRIEKELDDIRLDIERNSGDISQLVERQNRLSERFSELDGFYYKSKTRSTLLGLGFSEDCFDRPVSVLSGGQKTRLALAKILLSDCNLMLLDEPTNHLDIESSEWLESFLKQSKKAFIVISHDRYFLDRVTTRTFSIENKRLYTSNSNYSAFIKQRDIERLTEERKNENISNEIKRLEGIIEQQKRWNREKNIKTAESKQKVVDKLKAELSEPEQKLAEAAFGFKAISSGADDVLSVNDIHLSFDGNTILNGVSLDVMRGERIFLLGPNGCGKTSLLRVILGSYTPNHGTVKINESVKFGYYAQNQEGLTPEKSVLDEIWDDYPGRGQTEIRNALAAFLFRGDDVFKTVSTLSGGERARVLLTKLALSEYNLLILDEPTNHLDIESREALKKALDSFDGTLITVSHDRYFINELATKIVEIKNSKATVYDGNYDYYCEKRIVSEEAPVIHEQKKQNDYKLKKQLTSEIRKIETRIKRAETAISECEELIESLNVELSNVGTDYLKAAEISDKITAENDKLAGLYEEWEAAQNEHADKITALV